MVSLFVQHAIALHQQGHLAEAEALYRRQLAETPNAAEPHYYLGTLLMQQGRFAEAALFLETALRLKPGDISSLINHGMCLRLLGRSSEALARFEQAQLAQPNLAEIHFQISQTLGDLARQQEALLVCDRALTLQPGHLQALFYRALLLTDLEQTDAARETYDRLLGLKPDHVEALGNRALLAWQQRDMDAALAGWTRALSLDARHVPSLVNRALMLGDLGYPARALADYDTLLAIAPNVADIWNRRGATLRALERWEESLASFDTALDLQPDFALALCNRAHLRWTKQKRYDEAKADLLGALALEPDLPWLKGDLVHLKMQGADWAGRDGDIAMLAAGIAAGKPVIRPFAWQALSDDPASLQQCSRIYAAAQFPAAPQRSRAPMRDRIRIGYVSADFREQATAYLMAGVFEAHDRSQFEIIALDNSVEEDSPMRTRLRKAFGNFSDIASMSDPAAAQRVRDAQIDVLVNLNGYFGSPRNGVFALRPAPVQVNYLGFPATLGAAWMDYIIADPIVIPPDACKYYDEAVVWLPHSYQANDSRRPRPSPVSRAAAGLPPQGFVFCNFNQLYKLTPEIFTRWMRILQACEGSLLWLLRDNDVAADNLRRMATEHGVAAERLIFAEVVEQSSHLARLALADIFLDTMPYNAHTTGSDALWAGVPLVTCRGNAMPGRVAASLLTAIGLPELITENLDAYEALAKRLAHDTALLSHFRARMAQARESCALFDTSGHTRHLETAYRIMVENSRAGRPPQAFAVPVGTDAAR